MPYVWQPHLARSCCEHILIHKCRIILHKVAEGLSLDFASLQVKAGDAKKCSETTANPMRCQLSCLSICRPCFRHGEFGSLTKVNSDFPK